MHNGDESFYFKRKIPPCSKLNAILSETPSGSKRWGIEPNIRRMWVAVDNRLYIWKYVSLNDDEIVTGIDGKDIEIRGESVNDTNTNDSTNDFIEFSDITEPIQQVLFAPPKPDIFSDNINCVCIVATTKDIHVLGVNISTKDKLTLFNTGLSTPNSLRINKMAYELPTGRIFCAANDGSLFEVDYSAEDSLLGLRPKCRKLETTSFIWRVLPIINIFRSKDGLIDIAVDSKRGLLYTLSSRSNIACYRLAKGKSLSLVCELKNVHKTVKRRRRGMKMTTAPRNLVSIAPMFGTARICLAALCSDGARLYFALRQDSKLELAHLRMPQTSVIISSITSSFLNSEFCVISCKNELQHVTLDNGAGEYRRDDLTETQTSDWLASLDEYSQFSDFMLIHSPLLSEERTSTAPNGANFHERTFVEMNAVYGMEQGLLEIKPYIPRAARCTEPNVLVTQHCTPPRELHCLMNDFSVLVASERRPVDVLLNILLAENENQFLLFAEHYGVLQTCEMCLEIATVPGGFSYFAETVTDRVISAAKNNVLNKFGNPRTPDSIPEQALCLRLARILEGIWSVQVLLLEQDNILQVSVDDEVLSQILANLEAVYVFMADNQFFFDSDAQTERTLIDDLCVFALTAIDVINVLKLFKSINLSAISGYLPKELDINETLFCSCVLSFRGKEVIYSIVDAIIEEGIVHEKCGDFNIKDELVKYPRLFPASVMASFSGMECLYSALKAEERTAKQLLKRSLRFFKQASSVPLTEICERYRKCQYFKGVISICCSQALKRDPENVAYKAMNETTRNETNMAILSSRFEAYSPALDMIRWLSKLQYEPAKEAEKVLGKRSPSDVFNMTLMFAVSSTTDSLFHVFLYDLLVEIAPDSLCHLQTPYIEEFLSDSYPLLLVKYLVINNHGVKAANALYRIARGDLPLDEPLTLDKCLEYLAEARYLIEASLNDANETHLPGFTALRKSIEKDLSAVKIQRKIVKRLRVLETTVLESNPASVRERIRELESTISELDFLMKTCQQFGLYDVCILLLKENGICDVVAAKDLWERLILFSPIETPATLGTRVVETIKYVSQDGALCPLQTIYFLLELYGFDHAELENTGFATETLRQAGLDENEIVSTISQTLTETLTEPSFAEEKERIGAVYNVQSTIFQMLTKTFYNCVCRSTTLSEDAKQDARTVLNAYHDVFSGDEFAEISEKLSH